jgi:hypothetical protein
MPEAGTGNKIEPGGTAGTSPTPGGTGGGSSMPPQVGICTAICVPEAHLVVSGLESDELFTRSFEACRNGECYTAGPFQPSQGNTLVFTGNTWDQTTVSMFYDSGAELLLHLRWALPAYSNEFVDGDHYTLKAIAPSGAAATLIETKLVYERYTFCAGDCTRAYVPNLVRASNAAGEGGVDNAGFAGSPTAEAGSHAQGGAASE